MAVLCRFGAGPRMTRIHANRKKWVGAARRADPSLRRECAVSPNPNPPAEAPGRGGVYFGNTRDSATLLCRSSLSHPANIEYVGLTSFPEQKVMAALLCLGAGLGPRQHRI